MMQTITLIIFHFSFWGYAGNTSINEVKKEPEVLKQAIFTVWGDIYYIYEKGKQCFVALPEKQQRPKQLDDFISVVAIEATAEGNLLIVGLGHSQQIEYIVLDRNLKSLEETKNYQILESQRVEQIFGMTDSGDGGYSILYSNSGKLFVLKLTKENSIVKFENIDVTGKISVKDIQTSRSSNRTGFMLVRTDEKGFLRVEQVKLDGSVQVIKDTIPIEHGYDQYCVNDLTIAENGWIYLVGTAQKYTGANDPWMCIIAGTKGNKIIYNKASDERGNNQYQAILESKRNKFEVLRSHYDGYSVHYSIKSIDGSGNLITQSRCDVIDNIEGQKQEYGKTPILCSKNGKMNVLSTNLNGETRLNTLKCNTSQTSALDSIYIQNMRYVSPTLIKENKAESKEQGYVEISVVNPKKEWVHISPRLKCTSKDDPLGKQEFPFYATLKDSINFIRIPVRACKENFYVWILDMKSKIPSIFVQIEKPSTTQIKLIHGDKGRLDRIDNKLRIKAEIHHQLALKYIGIRLPNGHSLDLFANRNIISSKLTEVDTVLTWSEGYGLNEGENVLVLYAEDSLEPSLEPIKINFSKKKGILYVISIAPDYSNSKDYTPLIYNKKDARVIDSLLYLQKGKNALFEDVKRFHHFTKETTTKTAIDQRIEYIRTEIGPKMDPKLDITIFYFSGHGSISNDGIFEFIPTQLKTDTILVPLNMKNILNDISRIPGKKLIIMDACHSGEIGNIKSNGSVIENAIGSLRSQAPGTRVLTSSGKWQSSYESYNLKHSYFTFALIEALSNSYLHPYKKAGKPFLSDDALLIISDQDISKFAAKRLPELLQKDGKGANKQMPVVKTEETPWPLFGIRIK